MFNLLGIKFSNDYKEQFWKAILYDISNNRENQFEIRLREIMEYEVRGRTFKL
jgi:ribosomal protein L18E